MPDDAPRSTAPSDAQPLGPDTVIDGRYRLDAPIASGGMATVWRATDTVLTRPVAVKILHEHLAADPEFVARFRREAVAAARLAHPSIVAIYDTADEPECIVMELVSGRTLREELDSRGFLPPSEAVAIASEVCQALAAAHKVGIVHRDVKPANVLLGDDGRVKVADFGIAKAARSMADEIDDTIPDLTAVGRMVGTAKYLAPEQVSGGDVDARTDVYAVGALLYEALCGRPPFTGDNDLAVATARLRRMPDSPRSILRTIPPRLDALVIRALATDPDDRQPSAEALWADLQAVDLAGEAVPAPRADVTTVGEQPSFARAERSWLVPAGLISIVALSLGLAWLLIGGTEARRDFLDLVDRVAPGNVASDPEPVAIASVTAYDPFGTAGEHDDEAPLANDGDSTTGWTTERYDSRAFGGLKPGVGLILDLGESVTVSEVRVLSPDRGWSATVHVADRPETDFAAWGEPDGTTAGASEDQVDIDVDERGSYVLVWFTDLGDGPEVILDVREVVVVGR